MSYSPTLGRFIQRDPLGYVDGADSYESDSSNPLVFLDPTGTSSLGFGSPKPSGRRDGAVTMPVTIGPCSGKLHMSWVNRWERPGSGLGSMGFTGVGVKLDFAWDVGGPCCFFAGCQLQWKQTLRESISFEDGIDPSKYFWLRLMLEGIETKEHDGHDPFLGPVADPPGFVPNPFDDEPHLPVEDPDLKLYKRLKGKVRITKQFTTSLYCGDVPLGVTVNWSFSALWNEPETGVIYGWAEG